VSGPTAAQRVQLCVDLIKAVGTVAEVAALIDALEATITREVTRYGNDSTVMASLMAARHALGTAYTLAQARVSY
jgi:hypothetical protein